jgi:polyhydroxyalkanoate synthesis regulator phasin
VDERRDGAENHPPRGPLEQALLAGLGWASMTAEAAENLADDLAGRVGIDRGQMRHAVRDAFTSWRSEAGRVVETRTEALDRLLAWLGLVQKEEVDDIALRVAQLEHRLALLEKRREETDASSPL